METTNGEYVTRAELIAHLGPMRDDIHEIKDVALRLERKALEAQGRDAVQRETFDIRDKTFMRAFAGVGAIGALSSLLVLFLQWPNL